MTRRFRAIQWATGAMGKATLRTMIDHPDVDVVGVLVYHPDKVGRDAGDLARREPIGVTATNNVEDVLALEADVVVHVGQLKPYGGHDDELVRILESGKNVIAVNGYSTALGWDPARRERFEAACRIGQSTLVGAGLNPGVVGEQLAVVASGMCSVVEHIDIVESIDCSEIRNLDYLRGGLGFGAEMSDVRIEDPTWEPVVALTGMYEEVLLTIGERLGVAFDEIRTDHQMFAASSDIEIAAGIIRQGTVSHTRWRWHALVDGTPGVTLTINWFIGNPHPDSESSRPPEPSLPGSSVSGSSLWSVDVTGQPGVKLTVDLAKHPDDRSRMGAEEYAVGGTVVNVIPLVVDAPPGVLTRPAVTPARHVFGRERTQNEKGGR